MFTKIDRNWRGQLMDRPSEDHVRPEGVSDATVAATGKLSEALETAEAARGHLYQFHRLTGASDAMLSEAVGMLREAGHADEADCLERDLVGRNVLEGRWTFQIIEEYDDCYYSSFKSLEDQIRQDLVQGRRHLFEAEMKERERTHGDPAHSAQPQEH